MPGKQRPQIADEFGVGPRPFEDQSAAVHQHLRAAEQLGAVVSLQDTLHLFHCPRLGGIDGVGNGGQVGDAVPRRRKPVAEQEGIAAQVHIGGIGDCQQSKPERARLIGHLNYRDVGLAERLDEDGRRTRHARRPLAETLAQSLRLSQPGIEETGRATQKMAIGGALRGVARLFNRDIRHVFSKQE